MNRKQILPLVLIVVATFALAVPGFAQTVGDTDGDGVSNRVDRCPTVPGPASNNGCPLPENGGIPDRDGDGVADFVDQCPDQAGTGFTEGCPVQPQPEAPVIQPVQPQVVMSWESMDMCMVGVPLTSAIGVNIREQPTTSAAVIGHLAPGQQFAPFFRDYDENNSVWFAGAPAGESWGWVKESVVIDNGQCASLPMIVHVDAPGATHDLILPPNLDALDLIDDRATPVPLPRVGWEVLTGMGAGDHVLVVEGGEDGSPLARTGGSHNPYMTIVLKEVIITGVQPGGSGGGGGNPPPQPTPAPSPARPLPVLLVIADMQDFDCPAIGGGQCLLMALRLPEMGDGPGQCPPDSDNARTVPRLFEAAARGVHFKEVILEPPPLPTSEPQPPAIPAPQVMIDGDGSVVPAEQIGFTYERITWDYDCAVIGFVPTGESEAMGDGSVRFIVDTVVLLPALPAVQ